MGYPSPVNVIENCNRVGAAQMILSTAMSTAAQNLPFLGTENLVVAKAKAILVDKPSVEACQLAGPELAARRLGRGQVQRHCAGQGVEAEFGKLGIKVFGTTLQALACWFCLKSCQDSAEQFWRTLQKGAGRLN